MSIKIGLMGDVMIGRLVNEFLDKNPPQAIWGDILDELLACDLRLLNLEAALTTCENSVPKVFNFKADPEKVKALKVAKIDVVNLANNHILDFTEKGLIETLKTLDHAGISHVGAGINIEEAKKPAIVEKKKIRIGILGCTDNEPDWAAGRNHPGVFYIDVNDPTPVIKEVAKLKKKVDLIIVSIHWGPNMRERPTKSFQEFAHQLIENGVDLLHGHSAHIFQGYQVYQKGLILYDTGDFIDDYAVDPYLRNDCSFLFIVDVSKKGYESLHLIPTHIEHFSVKKAKGSLAKEIEKRMEMLSQEWMTITGVPESRP